MAPSAGAGFEELLAAIQVEHELELRLAVQAAQEENKHLQAKLQSLELSFELHAASSRESWEKVEHPFAVQEPSPSLRGAAATTARAMLGLVPSSPAGSRRAAAAAPSSPAARDASASPDKQLTEASSPVEQGLEHGLTELREVADEHEREQRRLAQRFQDQRGRGRARMSYVNIGNLEVDSSWQKLALRVVSNACFDAAIGLVIVANAVTIGIETSYAVRDESTPMAVVMLEHIFLCVYVIELLLRFYAVGARNALRANWVKFDFFLVCCGTLDVVIPLIVGEGSVEALEQVMLIRMLRLARLARTVRLLVQFRTLWLLVQGLTSSVMTLLWTFLIVISLTYVFAVVGMEIIRPDEKYGEDYHFAASHNFSNLLDAMMTLFQFFTLDSVGHIYRPIIRARPMIAAYFLVFVFFNSIALMNLITAIMVESSMRQAHDDIAAKKAWEEQKRKELMPEMLRMFQVLDADDSGELDRDEITNAPEDLKEQLRHVCKMDDLEELFNLLDYDSSGSVCIQAFIDGIMRTTSEKPPELLRLMKQCSDIAGRQKQILASLEDLSALLGVVPKQGESESNGI